MKKSKHTERKKPKIVLDTNILISGLGWQGNEYEVMRMCFAGDLQLYLSLDILKEFQDVVSRPKFGFLPEEIDEFLSALLECCELVIPQEQVDAIKKDPADNKVLACARAAQANAVISGDQHLLELETFKAIPILSAKEFLEALSSGETMFMESQRKKERDKKSLEE